MKTPHVFLMNLLISLYIWRPECESLVKGFPQARYKKFSTETEAWKFVHGRDTGTCFLFFFSASYTLHGDGHVFCSVSPDPSFL